MAFLLIEFNVDLCETMNFSAALFTVSDGLPPSERIAIGTRNECGKNKIELNETKCKRRNWIA